MLSPRSLQATHALHDQRAGRQIVASVRPGDALAGLRLGELLGLRVQDIEDDSRGWRLRVMGKACDSTRSGLRDAT